MARSDTERFQHVKYSFDLGSPRVFICPKGECFGVSLDPLTPIMCFFPPPLLSYWSNMEAKSAIPVRSRSRSRFTPTCPGLLALLAVFMFLITQPKKCSTIHHKSIPPKQSNPSKHRTHCSQLGIPRNNSVF